MASAVEAKRYTPEDLLTMPDGDRFELIDGQLVERNMSTWSSYIAGKLYGRLDGFSTPRQLAWVFPEGTSYQCFPNAPDKVRKPDVSAIKRDRMSAEQLQAEGHNRTVPDLAVEVVSPNDLADQIDERVQDFRRAGCRLVWVVHPQGRYVQVFRAHGHATLLEEGDELDGEDVSPDFRCRVAELFQP
jgi:Uma2 family endonuclease